MTSTAMVNLAQDAAHIYFSHRSSSTINVVAKSGGMATVLASGQAVPGRVAVGDDGAVYWANRGTNDPGTTTLGSVMRLAPGASMPTTIASGLDHAIEPTLLDGAVLWTVFGPMGENTMSGAVMAAPR